MKPDVVADRLSSSTIPPELSGRLWHTTNESRFDGISASGFILAEPSIPDAERWKSAAGREHYPYVRWIGGISLFDFVDFDPDSYDAKYPLSTWLTFVPFRKDWQNSLWIETIVMPSLPTSSRGMTSFSGEEVVAPLATTSCQSLKLHALVRSQSRHFGKCLSEALIHRPSGHTSSVPPRAARPSPTLRSIGPPPARRSRIRRCRGAPDWNSVKSSSRLYTGELYVASRIRVQRLHHHSFRR